MGRSPFLMKIMHMIDRSDMNLLTFKLGFDFLLASVWIVEMMILTSNVYTALCPKTWSDERCSEYVGEKYYTLVLTYVIPCLVLLLIYYHLRHLYRTVPHRAVEVFHIGMMLHIYINILFLLAIISVHAWVTLAIWILGFIQDMFVFRRIHEAATFLHPEERIFERFQDFMKETE